MGLKLKYIWELIKADRGTIIASLNYCRDQKVGWRYDAGMLADKLMKAEREEKT